MKTESDSRYHSSKSVDYAFDLFDTPPPSHLLTSPKDERNETIFQPGASFGDFQIVRLLGKGGMSEVYLAEGRDGKSRVAIKVLKPFIATRNESLKKRFVCEAEIAMEIRHPNLVAVYDAGLDPGSGLCFMIMEYMDGGSLKDFIQRKRRLSFHETLVVSLHVAHGLEVLAAKGIVHRDIKPGNILFTVGGVAKLTDFGVANFFGDMNCALTQADAFLGTPAYMSLEQMVDSHAVDARSDIYSLGIMMHEMLTGKRPHADESVVILLAKALEGREIPSVSQKRSRTPPDLAKLVFDMTRLKKESRPASVRDVTVRLADCLKREESRLRRARAQSKNISRLLAALPLQRESSFLADALAVIVLLTLSAFLSILIWERLPA